jgi:hypothetical protein
MKVLAWVLAAFYVASGAPMIFAPDWWFGVTPGVAATGPFNPHFVVDVGIAFLASGLMIAWGAAGGGWRLVLAGVLFPAGHALFHMFELLGGHGHGPLWVELLGIVAPASLAVGTAMSLRVKEY